MKNPHNKLTQAQITRLDKVVKELWERGFIGREIQVSTGYSNGTIYKCMTRQGLQGHKERYNKFRDLPIKTPPVKLWGEPIREYIEHGNKVSVYHPAYAGDYRGSRL